MKASKEEIQGILRRQRRRMVLAAIVAFILVYWLKSEAQPVSRAAMEAFLYAAGALIVYYFLIAEKPPRWTKAIVKFVVIFGTASWFTVGMFALIAYLDLIAPSKENRLLAISLVVVIFIIGAYIGTILLKRTRLRLWVEE